MYMWLLFVYLYASVFWPTEKHHKIFLSLFHSPHLLSQASVWPVLSFCSPGQINKLDDSTANAVFLWMSSQKQRVWNSTSGKNPNSATYPWNFNHKCLDKHSKLKSNECWIDTIVPCPGSSPITQCEKALQTCKSANHRIPECPVVCHGFESKTKSPKHTRPQKRQLRSSRNTWCTVLKLLTCLHYLLTIWNL